MKSDVDAALKVLYFAIYHTELTEMEDRENEREKELGSKSKSNRRSDGKGGPDTGASDKEG